MEMKNVSFGTTKFLTPSAPPMALIFSPIRALRMGEKINESMYKTLIYTQHNIHSSPNCVFQLGGGVPLFGTEGVICINAPPKKSSRVQKS